MQNTNQNKIKWEKEFDEEFRFRSDELAKDGNYDGTILRNELKQFISSLLQQQRNEIIKEIEEMVEDFKIKSCENCGEYSCSEYNIKDEIKAIIKKVAEIN